jgi:hypothetical protein
MLVCAVAEKDAKRKAANVVMRSSLGMGLMLFNGVNNKRIMTKKTVKPTERLVKKMPQISRITTEKSVLIREICGKLKIHKKKLFPPRRTIHP